MIRSFLFLSIFWFSSTEAALTAGRTEICSAHLAVHSISEVVYEVHAHPDRPSVTINVGAGFGVLPAGEPPTPMPLPKSTAIVESVNADSKLPKRRSPRDNQAKGGAVRRAFTLVELLVVITILGLMAALLLPAIHNARSAARSIQCQNNLRQLGVAVHNYESVYGVFPPALTQAFGNNHWWFGKTTPGSTVVDVSQGSLGPYFEGNSGVLHCPDAEAYNIRPAFSGAAGGYGYNYQYLAKLEFPPPTFQSLWRPVRSAQIQNRAKTIAFADSAGVINVPWPSGPPILIQVPMIEPPSSQFPSVHFRHRGAANILYIDGHVAAHNEPARNPMPAWSPASATQHRETNQVFDIGHDESRWDGRGDYED